MKKIQTKIMIMVAIATMGVSLINVALGTAISRNSTVAALDKTLSETAKLAALAAGLIPSIKAACVRFWLALSFVRFLECAEQNRLKTSPFHAAGSVQIM